MGNGAWSNPGPAKQVVIAGPSGEFLVYSDAPPRFGNLIAAISGAAGTDPYGNIFDVGLTLLGTGVNWGDIIFRRQSDMLRMARIIADSSGNLLLEAATDVNGILHLSLNTAGGVGGYQIGAGSIGDIYSRDMTWSQSLVSAAFTQLTAFTTVKQLSGYGTPFAAGVFTAPVDSFYDASLSIDTVAASTALVTVIRRNGANVAASNTPNVGRGTSCAVNSMWLNAGDTVTWHVSQTGGGTVVCTGSAAISRRLT